MKFTAYHAKYFAYNLTKRRPSDDIGKFTASLQDAQVDLNPHQVEAALFAFKSPLSKGAILADEVGLGKTIEAGIILSQLWAERKRNLLIIAPANLRKQWSQELADKFYLPSHILEAKTFNEDVKNGMNNPFNRENEIVICSYQFVKSKEFFIKNTNWNLVIIDEAHRLRNVYKPTNKTANSIKEVLEPRKKVLLTATPLQNSILELFGLVSIIDDYTFGDLKSFKSQFSRIADNGTFEDLRARLQPICQRTLRRQVVEYINYTKRSAMVEPFYPTNEEYQLYEGVSAYLQRDKLYALPTSQRQLMTLILRKLLASSSYAIYGTLDSLVKRLEGLLDENGWNETINNDFEVYDEVEDEWKGDTEDEENGNGTLEPEDREKLEEEIETLRYFRSIAETIKKNTKADKLITALSAGFIRMQENGANKKALIFTESRRTQDFLYEFLQANGYENEIVLFNGVNNDEQSRKIYQAWQEKHKGTDRVTGSPTADKRAALVDYFRENATLMIATEAAAEGINLQFCSLVVNYDLPWNPQRIEQRIGRCHRYGQKHDVVVINFLNQRNAADQRVYQLLDQKFQLFDGVFGASDEVLGAIGSGVDFEKRIAEIYNTCRDTQSIEEAFDRLQEELKDSISERIEDTRNKLLENFDTVVKDKLRLNHEKAKKYLNRYEENLWNTTKYFLQDKATFSSTDYSFVLNENPFAAERIHPGPYMVLKPAEGQRKSDIYVPDDTNVYRAGHPLAKRILSTLKESVTPVNKLDFNYIGIPKITLLEQFIGKSGWLQVSQLSIRSFEEEDYLIVSAFTDDGAIIESEIAEHFFSLEANPSDLTIQLQDEVASKLQEIKEQEAQGIITGNAERNRNFFDVEMDKLDQWADDMKLSLTREIEDLDAEIKLRKAEARKLIDLEQKVKAQRIVKDLERKRSERQMNLYHAQDEIEDKKDTLLDDIEIRLKQQLGYTELFTIKWTLN